MSVLLYRLGRATYDRPWYLIGGWASALAVVIGLLVVNPVRLSNAVRIDGTSAQQVIDDLAVRMPEASGGQGLLAFQAPEGTRLDSGRDALALRDAVAAVYSRDHVIDARAAASDGANSAGQSISRRTSDLIVSARGSTPDAEMPVPLVVDGQPVPGVLVSADGSVALFQFQFDVQTFELPAATVHETVTAAETPVQGLGIHVLPGASMLEIPKVVGTGEIAGIAVAAIVLLVTLGSVVAAGLPLVIALTGVGLGVGGAFTLSHLIEMHSLTAVLALMLGLAVGIDYALFIVNRARRLIMDQGLDAREATSRATATAGSAVLFAGATVVIALTGLLAVNIRLMTIMALVAASTVTIAVLLALTLLPALLGLLKERICTPKARTRHTARIADSLAHRWGASIVRRRYLALAATLVLPLLVAVPALDMRLGLPSGASYNGGTAQRQSYEAVSGGFGVGYNGPLVVAVNSPRAGDALDPGALAAVNADLGRLDGVLSVGLAGVNHVGDTATFSLIPASGPNDTQTRQLVRAIRDQAGTIGQRHDVQVGVTGFTALAIDVSQRLADAMPVYLGTVLALSLLIMLLVFRSVIVPIKATIGFLLSVFATFGATTAVFQWGWLQSLLGLDATAPVVSLLPIIVTGVLYGLAMDYQMFLVTSIREAHVHGAHGSQSVSRGLDHAARVVVAAAAIMVSVFAGFVFNADPMIKQVGFALAFGILVDAFVVRMTLVPAVMAIVGDRAWWLPRRLDRILPRLDIEGDQLIRQLNERAAQPGARLGTTTEDTSDGPDPRTDRQPTTSTGTRTH